MSEERPKGFLSRVFGPPEEEHTTVYSSDDIDAEEYEYDEEREEEGIEEAGGSFTVERAANA